MYVTSEVREGRDPQRWEEWNSVVEVRKIVKQSFEAELGLYHLSALSSVCTEDMYPRGVVLIQILLHEGRPLPGPETGLLSNTRKWIVRGDTCADKARDFIRKGHPNGKQ